MLCSTNSTYTRKEGFVMALIIRGYDLEKLNKQVLRACNTEERQAELQTKINKTMHELIQLQNELNNVKNMVVEPISRDMIYSLAKPFPWLSLSVSGDDTLVATCEKQPLFFHGDRSALAEAGASDLAKNEEVFYVSGHRYDFEAVLSSNGTISIRQAGAEVLSEDDCVSTKSRGIGHPHSVVDRYGAFSSVCQGNNRFMGAYRVACEEGITAEKLLLILRKLCIWFSSVNLSDMYGTSPCGSIDLPGDLQWLNSRECFTLSSNLLKTLQSEKEIYEIFMDVMDECGHLDGRGILCADAVLRIMRQVYDEYTRSVSSVMAYKCYMYLYNFLWSLCLHSWFGSNDTQGCVTRDCLIDVLRNDIRITLHGDVSEEIIRPLSTSEGPRILASPLALTSYASGWGVTRSAAELLKQTFSLDTSWLVNRLKEWDSHMSADA